MSRISAHSLRDGGIAVLKGFRQFIAQGNVLDLAVAVVIGGAFALVIKGLVDGIINPLIAAIFGKPDLTKVGEFTINGSQFSIGLVLVPLFTFLVTAAAVYFLVIVPYNAMKARMTSQLRPLTRRRKMLRFFVRSATR